MKRKNKILISGFLCILLVISILFQTRSKGAIEENSLEKTSLLEQDKSLKEQEKSLKKQDLSLEEEKLLKQDVLENKNPIKEQNLSEKEKNELAQMKLAAENEYLELYFDEAETKVAVRQKQSNTVWFTNPIDADTDPIAAPYNKQLMKSQFSVSYYNESVQLAEMDNYSDSIMEGQFEVEYKENGLTVTYTLGETGEKLILPQVIDEERFLNYLSQMEEKAQKQVTRNYTLLDLETMKESDKKENLKLYPALSEHRIYILKSGTKEYKQEELMEYFTAVGYTLEDMISDMEKNGYETEMNYPYFVVPLHYTIEKDNLIVSIIPEEITYNTDGYTLIDIDLMEYFGAVSTQEDGYLFVPDGSGALIYCNNKKTTRQSYTGQVYGIDKTVNFLNKKKSEFSENLTIKLPVFGIVNGKKALFAIIEDGEAFADINAAVSERVNCYNTVYAGFTYLQNGPISLGDIVGNNSFQMYAKQPYQGKFQIKYAFLSEDNATYSGMANYYRAYLEENGVLKRKEVAYNLPFYVEYIGAIDKTKSTLGIKYDATVALTTLQQAMQISSELKSAGIENQKIRYTGWMNGGLKSSAPSKVSPVSEIEKKIKVKEYNVKMQAEKMNVFFDVNFQNVYQDGWLDGYNSSSQGPRYFDKTVVKTGDYLIPNGMIPKKEINLISPYYLDSMVDKFLKAAKKYQLSGICAGTLATEVYSDFMEERYTNRQQAAVFNQQALEKLSEQYQGSIMGENAAAYAFNALSDIIIAPMDSNNFQIIDESIPFYEMVIRGYIEYAGNPLNLSDDYTWTLLKSIETGAGLYYQWIYADNSVVKETDYSYLYSVDYKYWLEDALEQYQKLNLVFSKLQGQTIINHEKVENGVYLVTYEKGTQIAVNYNNLPCLVNNITVAEKDFAVVKEGN